MPASKTSRHSSVPLSDVGKRMAQQSMLKQLHKQPETQITESIWLLKIYFHQFKVISSGRWW